jgi:hypothetical protein
MSPPARKFPLAFHRAFPCRGQQVVINDRLDEFRRSLLVFIREEAALPLLLLRLIVEIPRPVFV